MSIARIAETIENPSVPQLLAAYPTKDAFDTAFRAGKIKRTQESGAVANIFNRIVDDALAKQAQVKAQTTVMEDLTAPRQPMGLTAAAQPQALRPQMQQPVMARAGGLTRIPIRDNMYEMAGGGIVAFQNRGLVRSPKDKVSAYFEALEDYRPSELRGVRGAELSAMFMDTNKGLKIDPVTGEPISLGEFMRRVESKKIPIPENFVLPAPKTFTETPAATPSTAQTAIQQAAVEDPMRGQSDVGYIPPEVFAADQKEAQARNAAALAAAREAAPAPTRQPVAPPQAAAPTQVAAAPQDFDISAEAKRVADARKAFLGEDPYTKYLTEQLEKGGEEQFTDRALRALQMIQAGEQIREGRAGAETALPTLLKQRQADVSAKEARAEKLAQLKGREYETQAKAFEAAYGKGEELAKEERTAKRKEAETKADREFRRELVNLQASLRPKEFNAMLFEKYEKGTPEQRKVIEDFQRAGKVGTQITENQLAQIRSRAIQNAKEKYLQDPRYTKAKSAEERQRVLNTIEKEEFDKLMTGFAPATGASGYDYSAADALVGI